MSAFSDSLKVCTNCRNGTHNHDRRTSDGSDAGCPYMAGDPNSSCQCRIIVHTARSTANGAHCATCTCGTSL